MEIFFGHFEDEPTNFVEIERKLRANHEILQFFQDNNAKIRIQSDRVTYLVPQKNVETIKNYLRALIEQAILELVEVN